MTLDRYMDDFGNDLARAGRARARRRRRVRLALALPAAAALAVAVAALPGTDGDVDAVAAAREALAPVGRDRPHEGADADARKNVMRPDDRAVVRGRSGALAQRPVVRPSAATRRPQRRAGDAEIAYSNDRVRMYDKRRDVVQIYDAIKLLSSR